MRITIIFLISMLVSLQSVYSQQRPQRQAQRQADERKEAIETRKISYITRTLNLTPSEAREFWPIYNEYTRKVEELSDNFRKQTEALPEPGNMTDAQARQFVEAEISRFEKSSALRREYTEKMLEVISVQQVALLFEAERSFHRMLFREAQGRQRHSGQGGN